MYIDTMQQVYSNASKVLIDAKGSGNLLYLPLDKMMQSTSPVPADATNAVAMKPVVPETPLTQPRQDVDGRSRDALRNRERGDR
jgi:membrane protease subunit HflK